MSNWREIVKKFAIRIGVVLSVILLAWAFTSFVVEPVQQPDPTMQITGIEEDVKNNSSVINYESLTDEQQSQFRDSVGSMGRSSIDAGYETLQEYEYIYLDGKYYSIESQDEFTDSESIVLIMELFGSFVGGLAVLVYSLGSLSAITAMGLSIVGVSEEQYSSWGKYTDTEFFSWALIFVLLGGVLISPVAFDVTQTSAVKYEDSPPEGLEVVQAESLSEEEAYDFRRIADGDPTFHAESLSEYEVIKSDGEYYEITQSYPLSSLGVMYGIFVLGVEIAVFGVIVLFLKQVGLDLGGHKSVFADLEDD